MTTSHRIYCLAVLLPGAFLLTAAKSYQNPIPPAKYTITDLGTLGGDESFANAINNQGQITFTFR